MKLNKKFLSALSLALAMIMLAAPISATSLEDYTAYRQYNDIFTDVSKNDWFYDEVASAYSLGIIGGKTNTTYVPDGNLTIAEAIKLAVSCHQLLSTGSVSNIASTGNKWYDGYVSYAKLHNIVTEDYDDYDASALRAQVGVLFSRAAVNSGVTFNEINSIEADTFKDVFSSDWFVSAIYRLYKWGIMTGDGNGYINPNSTVRRSEIAAIVIRMIDEDSRVKVGASNEPTPDPDPGNDDQGNEPVTPPVDPEPTSDPILLHEGTMDKKEFTGLTGFAADFNIASATPSVDASYYIDHLNTMIIEEDNISFRLYQGVGYEALGILRGWYNDAVTGVNGVKTNEPETVKASLNSIFKLWINGKSIALSEMWYYNHGDYTTYAFYFKDKIDTETISDLKLVSGKLSNDILIENGLRDLVDLIEAPTDDPEDVTPTPDPDPTPDDTIPETAYKTAIDDAKSNAVDVIFEYENTRCTILYGCGLYGRGSDEYRLLFIFRDGTVQTVTTQKLIEIRMNSAGDVLYYTVTAPDNKSIQYGVNFGS